jgi:hypothetical protein
VLKTSGLARSLVEELGGRGGEAGMNNWSPGVFRFLKLFIKYYNGGHVV